MDKENLVFGLLLAALVIVLVALIITLVQRNRAYAKLKSKTETPSAHYPPAAAEPVPTRSAPGKAETEKSGAAKANPALMGSLSKGKGPAPAVVPPRTDARDRKSIDEHYADSHGQWKCPYCETLNDDDLFACVACGQPRG